MIETTQLTERASLKFTFGVYNLANATSFDIPINNVPQQPGVQPFSALWGVPLCSSPTLSGLRIVNKTIGSPRQIQMTLRLNFSP